MKRLKKILLIITCLLCISGCRKSEIQENKQEEAFTEVQTGIYIGGANKTTGYVPMLTLKDDKTYELKVSKACVFNGNYHVDNNMLILTLSAEKSFTLSNKDNNLVLNEEIPQGITKGTSFKLWGSFEAEVIEQETTTEENNIEESSENKRKTENKK